MSASPGIFTPAAPASRKRQILIAGGGISGLAAALALEQHGFAVTVFERAERLPEDGAGIQLSPNATRLLSRLKVLTAIEEGAVEVRQVLLMSPAAKPLLTLDVANARGRWGAPWLTIHRADLAQALLSAAQLRPAISLRIGAEITHFAGHANGVTASVTASSGVNEHAGIFLIGADGVGSKVRGEISGAGTKNTGFVAHRRTINANGSLPACLRQLMAQQQVAAFLAQGAHLVAYPLRQGTTMNLVLISKARANDSGRRNANAGSPLTEAETGNFGEELRSFLESSGAWTQWPIFTVPHAARWSDGSNAMLIGDAAHAMTPFGAQGAAMAIEDAWTLAACLGAHRDNLPAAAAAYEKRRRPRIRRVALRSELNRVAYHARGPMAAARAAIFWQRGQKMLDGLDWLYSYDPADLGAQTMPSR